MRRGEAVFAGLLGYVEGSLRGGRREGIKKIGPRVRPDFEVQSSCAISLVAAPELEGIDAGVPVEATGGLVVLLGVPDGAIVGRIDRHGRVVAPAIAGALLNAGALDDEFRRFHWVLRIRRYPSCVHHTGIKSRARGAEAKSDVTELILSHRSH